MDGESAPPTRQQLEARVLQLLTGLVQVDERRLTPDADLRADLGLDSIDLVDLAAGLQTFTQQRLGVEELRQVRTVTDMVDLVERKLLRGGSPLTAGRG
jgi:acyl carrier protein